VDEVVEGFKALSNERRLHVLEWLRDPRAHFPPQRDGDLVDDGVCVVFIAEKLGVTQPTATAHLQSLRRAGFVTAKRVGKWTFYKRDEEGLGRFKDLWAASSVGGSSS
jgi:DNA-binding transcriptional ArsR family regulator